MTLPVYLHLVVLKGLESFSSPDRQTDRQTGYIIATSRVSQAGQNKRLEPDENECLGEGTPLQNPSGAGSSESVAT
jgi:hypothetical protein